MSEKIILFISIAALSFGVYYLMRFFDKRKSRSVVVKYDRTFICLFTAMTVCDIALGIYKILNDDSLWIFYCIFVLLILSISILVVTRYRITYDEQGFEHRNMLGIKRSYSYSDIEKIDCENQFPGNADYLGISIGKREIIVTSKYPGGSEFIELVKQKYSQYHSEV